MWLWRITGCLGLSLNSKLFLLFLFKAEDPRKIHLRWENNYVMYTSSQMYKTIIRRYLARTLFVFKYHWTLQNSTSCEFSSLAQKVKRKRMSHQSASCNGSNLEVVWLALPVVSLSITFIFSSGYTVRNTPYISHVKPEKRAINIFKHYTKWVKISRVELNISSPLRMPNRNTCTYIKLDLCKTASTHQIPALGLLFLDWILQIFL